MQLFCLEARRLVVLVKVGLEGKGLLTPLALVVFESRMGLHMGSEKNDNF
jgi:hypothetical protein